MATVNDNTIRRYLLDGLGEEERAQFEAAYFEDDALYERMMTVESTMIDEYAYGKLPSSERRAFVRHFYATPERRARVDEAKRLQAIVAVPWGTRASILRGHWQRRLRTSFEQHTFVWALAMLLILIGSIAVFRSLRQPAVAPHGQIAADQEAPAASPNTQAQHFPEDIASARLVHSNARLGGGGVRVGKLRLAPTDTAVRLTLAVPPSPGTREFQVYAATVSAGGAPLWHEEKAAPVLSNQDLELRLPREIFPRGGSYSLVLDRYKTAVKNPQQRISTRYLFTVEIEN